MHRVWVVALGLVFVLSACLSNPGGEAEEDDDPMDHAGVPSDWHERAVPVGDDHDHRDLAGHKNRSTPNFQVLGFDPLITMHDGHSPGGHFCAGLAQTPDATYAVAGSYTSDVAMVVVDVSDPVDPVMVGELVLEGAGVTDVDVVGDASYAVLSTVIPRVPDFSSGLQEEFLMAHRLVDVAWRDPCGGSIVQQVVLPYGFSTVLVDLRDPTVPVVTDSVFEGPMGPHSVFATTIGGEHLILSSTVNFLHQTGLYSFYGVEEVPGIGPRLVPVGSWTAQQPEVVEDPQNRLPVMNSHLDGWIAEHPLTGQVLAYLANWDGGVVILEYEGPHQLVPVSVFNDYDSALGDGMSGQWHGVLPLDEPWDERHYTVIHQEVLWRPEGRPTGQVALLDTTDPTDPFAVARWALPVELGDWTQQMFSTHYVAHHNGTLFVSLFHGGLWAVDASPQAWPEMDTIGVFIPDRESPAPLPENMVSIHPWRPLVTDVSTTTSGTIVVFETAGVYVLGFDNSMEVPRPAPWHDEPWHMIR